ncbi:MAG: multiple sugar transport system ATP-binding [Beijerinckiaceae bacterium]|nr:MAG: multiple sugar transport system ATP-binding [Beijerinckiaceae bacterium]
MLFGLTLGAISKAFGTTRVLDRVSLTVEPGEFVSLVGPSGCGKSTLLRIIAGLERQDDGTVSIGSRVVDALSPRQRNIAMVFQNYALYPHMSAFENIALPLSVGRLSLPERLPLLKYLSPRRARIMREIANEVEAVAGQLKIEALLARKPGQLSGGQRQRVALARAMVRQPSLFLMDEPLSNLDAQLRVHMRDELTDLHARLGATFVYVTHDQIEAMTMSSRVAMLDQGRLAQFGTPIELYDRPATLAVATFIGSPAINVLAAHSDARGAVAIAGRASGLHVHALPDQALSLCVRPEHLRLARPGETPQLLARLRRNEHYGAERLLHFDLAGDSARSVIVRLAHDENAALGGASETAIGLAFEPQHAHLFNAEGLRVEALGHGTSYRTAAQ